MNLNDELDADLPDELLNQHASDNEARMAKIQSLSMIVTKKRDEATSGRSNSGIEEEWAEDTDAYEGIDDANRSDQKVIKPTTSAGGITRRHAQSNTRSTVFLNITRPYVDSAAARIGDMLMPTDDRSWQLKEEPISEGQAPALAPVGMAQGGMPQGGLPPQGLVGPQGVAPVQQPPMQATPTTLAVQEAMTPVEKAQRRIDDWLVESQWHAECRKVIDDCCRIGVGILKGPFPKKSRAKRLMRSEQGVALEIQVKINPASKRIDPWNFYPDPSCGEDIHAGNYCFEHDSLTERQLRDLMGVEGYLDDQIKECLKEGPQKKYANSQNPSDKDRNEKDLYDVWYYYGMVSADDLTAAGVKDVKEGEDAKYAIVTLVNDRAIKAALNPLDSGEFPYDVVPYQRRAGSWAGIGVARQVRTPQGMINAGTRNMLDNAALSGGPIIAIDRQMLEPVDGTWNLVPRKFFYTTSASEGRDIRTAIATFDIPSKQVELMNIIQFALKMAEDVTGMPMLLQGQTGAAPDTLGGQLLANNNAAAVLRRFSRLWDDCITEPHIRRYYEFLLIYGEKDDEKGAFTIDARGSSALVERDIQNHAAMQILQFSVNPAFGINPKKAAEEALKAQRLDPKRFQFTDEELAKMQQNAPPPAPAVQAAQIRAQADMQKTQLVLAQKDKEAQLDANVSMQKVKLDVDRDTVYVNAQSQRDQTQAQLNMEELRLKRELAMMDYANKHQLSLEQVKAKLAETAMKINAQKELSMANLSVDVHKHHNPSPQVLTPPTEPAGRAPDGQAFSA